MTIQDAIQAIRLSIISHEEPEITWHHFYSLNSEFNLFEYSDSQSLPELQPTLERAVNSSLDIDVPINELLTFRVVKSTLYHGICWARGVIMAFFYFADIEAGIVAIPNPPMSQEVDLVRFEKQRPLDLSRIAKKSTDLLH